MYEVMPTRACNTLQFMSVCCTIHLVCLLNEACLVLFRFGKPILSDKRCADEAMDTYGPRDHVSMLQFALMWDI